ncbi:hypothetical protein D3C77_733380 [compost metagenome]
MFVDLEASPQRVRAQTIDCQWHQPITIQAQKRGSVARQQAAHGFEQTSIAFALGQVAGQIADQWQQGG